MTLTSMSTFGEEDCYIQVFNVQGSPEGMKKDTRRLQESCDLWREGRGGATLGPDNSGGNTNFKNQSLL